MFRGFSFFKSTGSNDRQNSMTDAELKHCPQCGDEFRPEFSHCAACKCELVSGIRKTGGGVESGRSRDNRDLEILPSDELLTMRRGSLAEMKHIQRLLKKKFVGSLLAEDRIRQGKGCCNSKIFNLNVKKQDAAYVQQVLVDDFRRTTALDDHLYQPEAAVVFDQRSGKASCPACGCQFHTGERTCPECGLCF